MQQPIMPKVFQKKKYPENVIIVSHKPESDYILRAYSLLEKGHKKLEIWSKNYTEKAIFIALRLEKKTKITGMNARMRFRNHLDTEKSYTIAIKVYLEAKNNILPNKPT